MMEILTTVVDETNDEKRRRIRLTYFMQGPSEEARRALKAEFDNWLLEHDAALLSHEPEHASSDIRPGGES